MKLSNKKIKLRAPELQDIDVLYQWENDESIWYLSNTHIPFSRFDLEQYILNSNHDIFSDKQYRFIIEKQDSKEVIGCIDLFDFDPLNKRAGVGILLDEKFRGQGLASDALMLFIQYAFEYLNLHQLFCNILASNTKSLILFKRKQFSIIGVKRDWVFSGEEYHDEILLQLIRKSK